MKTYYITFGQSHTHELNGMLLCKDRVLSVQAEDSEDAHKIARDLFGDDYASVYTSLPNMSFYPKGMVAI